MLKIKITKDFRTFKKGESFSFDKSINIIVGSNGSGKSSLMHALRGKYEKDSRSSSLHISDYKELSDCIEVETDYDDFFFLDSVNDDSMSFMNSFNAGSFLENDGKINVSISHAQRQHLAFNKLLAKLDAYRIKNATTKILVVLDEFDKGFYDSKKRSLH